MTFEFPLDPETICQTLYNSESTCSRCIGYCKFHNAYVTHKKEELKLKKIHEKRIEEEKLSKFHIITKNQKKKNIHIRQKRFIILDLKTCRQTEKSNERLIKRGNSDWGCNAG